MYPDERVLVAIMNNKADWQRVLDEHWYRLPVKHAPAGSPHFSYLAFYFTRVFGSDKWAIHYYAPLLGHELLTRRRLIPSQPHHKRAGHWYYKLELGQVHHKIPPIVADKRRRITFIVTTGDRFEAAREINDLVLDHSPTGLPYVRLQDSPLPYE